MFGRLLAVLCNAFVLFALATTVAQAASWNTNVDNVVLDGYDVVAYRTEDRAIKGDRRYVARYDGVKFYFASKENREAFIKNADAYVPKYNGFCAFAVGAKGAKVPADPNTFKFYNGELLVFFNDLHEGRKFNTKVPWNSDERDLYSQAETNWKKLNARQ